MRLIDKDEILNQIGAIMSKYPEDYDEKTYKMIRDEIRNEKREVEAIPVKWVEKEMERLNEDIKWAWYYGNTALDKMEYLKMWLTIKMEEWRKDNG